MTQMGKIIPNDTPPRPPFSGTRYISVGLAETQTVATATWVKVALASIEYNPDSVFDNSNYRYTSRASGLYSVVASLGGNLSSANNLLGVAIYMNGVRYKMNEFKTGGAGGLTVNVSALIPITVSSDYLEMYGWTHGTTFISGTDQTFFQACRVAAL